MDRRCNTKSMNNLKLLKDFGVRALLATIAAVGFYGLLTLVIIKYPLDTATLIALIGLAQAPLLAALAFYFGSKITNTQPPGR